MSEYKRKNDLALKLRVLERFDDDLDRIAEFVATCKDAISSMENAILDVIKCYELCQKIDINEEESQ